MGHSWKESKTSSYPNVDFVIGIYGGAIHFSLFTFSSSNALHSFHVLRWFIISICHINIYVIPIRLSLPAVHHDLPIAAQTVEQSHFR